MNFLAKRSFLFSPLMCGEDDISLSKKIINGPSKASRIVLGVCSAAIAFPFITLAIMFSVFFPEEEWEEFWDKFLE